uniref:Glycosyltransferase family 92 protein n=2 Tax=Anthurium amnicola TaxID=1678845 RepID=A0A1D1Z1Y4_9ARAE
MKDHRRKQPPPQPQPQHQHHGNMLVVGGFIWKGKPHAGGVWGRPPSWCTLTVVLCCALLSALTFSTFRLFGVSFHPVVIATWQQAPVLHAVSTFSDGEADNPSLLPRRPSSLAYPLHIHHAVSFPDQLLLFLNYPSRPTVITSPARTGVTGGISARLRCLYFPPSSPRPSLHLLPISVDLSDGIVRCPLPPHRFLVSLGDGDDSADGVGGSMLPVAPMLPRQWDFLAYDSLLDGDDNSTIVFVKGLNLRPERLSDASRYECVFGWDFTRPRYLITSNALTVAQEIVRCRTPLSVLRRHSAAADDLQPPAKFPVMVSVKARGRGARILPSVTRPTLLPSGGGKREAKHRMCICTMVRNQARFLTEWITYHAHIGVERWFIYDNNSEDSAEHIVRVMEDYNVTRHAWPWVKTQEAGFAHCALRARAACEWVGFMDVDEFLYLPSPELSLHDVLKNYSMGFPHVAELRTVCHTFGPSGHRAPPPDGVTMGYTCRMASPERHKSIIRPEALSPSLINVVHHFHLKDGFQYVNMDRGVMVINHYKYQAWEVFKEKFYRRVATYVADWQDEENVGSKDRAPGLGTKAVEPPDWHSRFCEVKDTGLRDRVLRILANQTTGQVPW